MKEKSAPVQKRTYVGMNISRAFANFYIKDRHLFPLTLQVFEPKS